MRGTEQERKSTSDSGVKERDAAQVVRDEKAKAYTGPDSVGTAAVADEQQQEEQQEQEEEEGSKSSKAKRATKLSKSKSAVSKSSSGKGSSGKPATPASAHSKSHKKSGGGNGKHPASAVAFEADKSAPYVKADKEVRSKQSVVSDARLTRRPQPASSPHPAPDAAPDSAPR